MSGVISRDVPNTLYEGELEKRGQLIRNWRPRYFVLWRDGPRLQYLARSPTNVWVPKGQINLQSVMSCTSATGQCVFKITTTDGVIHLRAKSQTICDIWIRAISACVAHKDNLGTVESMPAFDGGLAFRNRRKSVSNALVMVKPVESSPAAATLSSAASPAPSRDVVTEKSHGTLTLTIKSATDLLSKDRSGSADPYCRVYYDGYEVTTHACLNTLNPVWDKVFTLPFNRSIVQLTVDVFDYEESSKERFLGRAVVPLASVTDDKQTLMYELCKRSFKSHVRGVLCLELSTDVVEDRVLSSLFTLARSIPSLIVMRETSGPTSSVLYPPASAEAVIDASSVRMFPYFPSTPAAESQFIDGTLIFTNYRFMFVVAGHLSPVVPSLSPTPVHTTSMEDMSALMGPASFSPSVGLVSDDEEEGDEEDTIGISVAGQESVDIEPAAPSAPAPVATPAPDCEEFTVETEFVDGTSAQDTIPLPAFQVPLANVIGTMRYERTLGVASCGSLETIASSSMFEFAKGQPVLQLDCEGFKSPAFVFLPSEDGSADATATSNKVVQCSRWYEVISNSIFNRHLEPKKCLTAWVKAVGAGDDAAVPAAPGLSSSTTLMAEYRRQGIPNHFWRISTVNQAYALSPTYPSVLVVPRIISDAVLQDAAPFRSKARIPVLTWLHPLNGACLARCSQPMVGLIGHRNSHDEQIIEALRTSMPLPSQLILIADVRPKINAVTNQAQGKGYETVGPGTNYPTACLHFMNVPNIHVMRKSLETIRKAAVDVPEQSVVSTDYEATSVLDDDIPKSKSGMSASDAASATWSKITGMFSAPAWSGAPSSSTAHVPTSSSTGPPPAPSAGAGAPTDGSDTAPSSHLTSLGFGNIGNDSGWMATVADSGWLNHCALLLGAASRVSTVLNRDAVPVVVHCSDGWDRTAQVCALSQILLDPYFRTLAGFWVLVEKEWVSFGHKFRDRLGFDHESGYRSDERSPVFLQFLDCVRMICKQHPHSFEFNLHLLAYLAEYSSCAWFPTFTSNCESERCRDVESTGGNAPSLWDTITVNQSQFTNAGYISPPLFALTPQAVVGSPGKYRREWHNAQVLTVEYSVRKLSVWTELITGWQVHVPRLFAAVQSCTCFRFATICAYCRSRSSNRRGGKPGTALTTDTTGSASRLGYHGGLTMGLKLGPSKGDSHCFRCRHEFLSMIRPRKHCFACQRSMCKNCSVKVDSSELGRLVSGIPIAGVPKVVLLCKLCEEQRKTSP